MGYSKITLYGGQTCDYLYIEKNRVNESKFSSVESEPTDWNDNTLFFAKFNNNLTAGDSSVLSRLTGYEVRRRKGAEPHSEYVCTVKNTEGKRSNFIVDYAAANDTSYTYYLHPSLKAKADNTDLTLTPIMSDEIIPKWNYWSLLVVDESDEENVYYVDKIFKFELNLSVDDMSNNAQITVTPNFTSAPTVQYGSANYWSGSLTALCGFIACDSGEYMEPFSIINELKKLTTDTRKKFLKDTDGNVFEVKITSAINISRTNGGLNDMKSVKVSWAEVGTADGISIINNPNTTETKWLLTEHGFNSPYTDYVWDDTQRWDNSYIWTSNKDDNVEEEFEKLDRDLFAGGEE